jgi:hypothetical protein
VRLPALLAMQRDLAPFGSGPMSSLTPELHVSRYHYSGDMHYLPRNSAN